MELKIISPAEDGYVKKIEFNFGELKSGLEASLKKYQGLAYTDDTIQDAKTDRAKLNKLKKALNDKRLEIKRRCLEPYDTFEAKIKELVGLIDRPVLAIDSQVKGYEERKRTEKQQHIQAFWDVQESKIKSMVHLSDIFDERWMNVTYSMTNIEDEITAFLKKVEEELNLLYGLETEYEDQVIRTYLKGFKVAAALAEDKALKEAAAAQEEFRKQREAAEAERKAAQEAEAERLKAKRDQAKQAQPAQAEPAAPQSQARPVEPVQGVPAAPPVHCIDFRVWATNEQLSALREFMTTNNIKYGRVDDRQAA